MSFYDIKSWVVMYFQDGSEVTASKQFLRLKPYLWGGIFSSLVCAISLSNFLKITNVSSSVNSSRSLLCPSFSAALDSDFSSVDVADDDTPSEVVVLSSVESLDIWADRSSSGSGLGPYTPLDCTSEQELGGTENIHERRCEPFGMEAWCHNYIDPMARIRESGLTLVLA